MFQRIREKETPREVAEYKGFKVIGEVTNTAFNGNIIFFNQGV